MLLIGAWHTNLIVGRGVAAPCGIAVCLGVVRELGCLVGSNRIGFSVDGFVLVGFVLIGFVLAGFVLIGFGFVGFVEVGFGLVSLHAKTVKTNYHNKSRQNSKYTLHCALCLMQYHCMSTARFEEHY